VSAVVSRERLLPIASSLMAILLALIVGGIFLELRGKDALNAYDILFERGLINRSGLTETFKTMAPLLMLLRFVTGPQAPTIEGSLWGRGAGAGPVAVVL